MQSPDLVMSATGRTRSVTFRKDSLRDGALAVMDFVCAKVEAVILVLKWMMAIEDKLEAVRSID